MRTRRVLKCRRHRINHVMGVPVVATGGIRKAVNVPHRGTFPMQAILLSRRALSNQQLHRRQNREQSRVRSDLALNRDQTQEIDRRDALSVARKILVLRINHRALILHALIHRARNHRARNHRVRSDILSHAQNHVRSRHARSHDPHREQNHHDLNHRAMSRRDPNHRDPNRHALHHHHVRIHQRALNPLRTIHARIE